MAEAELTLYRENILSSFHHLNTLYPFYAVTHSDTESGISALSDVREISETADPNPEADVKDPNPEADVKDPDPEADVKNTEPDVNQDHYKGMYNNLELINFIEILESLQHTTDKGSKYGSQCCGHHYKEQ